MKLTLIFALALSSAALAADSPKKPNIVVMLVDDLGSGDVSSLLRKEVQTPNIDRLAQGGVKFTSGYVPVPVCGPSRAAFFSGVYPQRFGFRGNDGGIPVTQPLFPAAFRNAGYRTGLIGKWHSSGPMPHQRGCFDETLCSPKSSPFIDYHHPKLARNGKVEESSEYSSDLFAREAESFIERHQKDPFFLTVTFNAPHILKIAPRTRAPEIAANYDAAVAKGETLDVPLVPMARPGDAAKFASKYPGDTARADTVATITALDEAVGRILDQLKKSGLEENTIVFFFGDNGGHPENRSENLPLRDYKWTLFEGGIRVPFFARYPAVFPAGLEFSQPVISMDLFATCAALTGTPPPAQLDGVNLTPFLTGEKKDAPHEALFFSIRGFKAVRQDQWKLVAEGDQAPQLYDLSKDIGEKTNLAAAEPVLVKQLTEKWQKWNAQLPPEGKRKRGAEDAE